MNLNRLVSIISPCYNGASYLPLFLDSVISQSYRPIELIVVDDGSTDNTFEILESYKDIFFQSNIIYHFYKQENKGQAAAINTALNYFAGDYLMWVDSDDILLEGNVAEKVCFLESHNDCGLVISQGVIVNSADIQKPIGYLKREKTEGADDLFSDLVYAKNVIFCPGVYMVTAEAFHSSIPTNSIFESREGQNWQMLLPIVYNYQFGYIDKILFKCVAHSDSHSRQKRNYNELLNRERNFEVLLIETINRIEQMPDKEKEEWRKKIIIKQETRILRLARDNNDRSTYNDAKNIIKKNGGSISKQDCYSQKIINRIKRITPRRILTKIKSYFS